MNSDHGSQFTGSPLNTALTNTMIEVSMNGRGQYLYNIFFERLWRSLKQAAIYLHDLQDGFKAKQVIDSWIAFYNADRLHTAHEKQTPDDGSFGAIRMNQAA